MRSPTRSNSNTQRLQQTVQQLVNQGKNDDALRKIRAHLTFSPNDVWFLHEAARLLRRSGQLEQAKRHFRKLLTLNNNDAGALNGLGLSNFDEGDFTHAEHYYQAALNAHQQYAACHNNYAILLHKTHRYEEALNQYQLALSLQPEYSEARYGMSTVLAHIGKLAEAEASMLQVLSERPHDTRCINALSMVQLPQGKFAEGWKHYQARYSSSNPERFYTLASLSQPYWQGEDLSGKTILVKLEQGFGDAIQFCRFVSRLKKEKNAATVILSGRDNLRDLLKDLPDVDLYLGTQDRDTNIPFDYWCMVMDLPMHFIQTTNPFIAQHPYILTPKTFDERWLLDKSKYNIGIVWKGSPEHKNDAQRSVNHLSELAPLLSLSGINWVSLQKGAGENEVEDWPMILPLGAQCSNYQDTAAILSQLDLVIGVDTSVIHLAGAMGIPCWVMLPAYARDWRWLQGREDSPWYPEMRLFPRGQSEGWSEVVERIKSALAAQR